MGIPLGAGVTTSTAPVTVSQAEREAAAYNNAMAAARRGDRKEHARLWAEYARICAERPAGFVATIEVSKGLR